jgi:hypothetical protein
MRLRSLPIENLVLAVSHRVIETTTEKAPQTVGFASVGFAVLTTLNASAGWYFLLAVAVYLLSQQEEPGGYNENL